MSLNSGKDLLQAKYITAIIIDSSNRGFFIPIKYVIGDYFCATIEKQLYCFKLEGARIYNYRHLLRKSLRFTIYFTDHYKALDAKYCKEIENVLLTNSLPKINNRLLDIMKLLGKKEKVIDKESFQGHDLGELIEMVARHEKDFPEQAENLKNYLERLDTDKIITHVKPISEFIEGDLKTTDAKFLGEIAGQIKRTEVEQKKMANTPLTAKGPWLKIILVVVIIGMGAGLVIWLYSSGALDHIMPQLPGSSSPGAVQGTLTTQEVMSKYPTPEALKAAIDSGQIKLSNLNAESKKFLDSYKPPIAVPGSH